MDEGNVPATAIIDHKRVRIGSSGCAVGESAEGYVLRAVLSEQAPPLAVIESAEGVLVFASEAGPQVVLEPRMEGANAQGFDAAFFERLLEADGDPLGEQALAAGEPGYEAIAELLPRVVDDTFVGDPRVA